jgi:RimJ/RimL family protein N-acetyltransferase
MHDPHENRVPENRLPNGLPQLPGVDALTLRTNRLDLIPISGALATEMFQVLKDPALYEYVTSSPPADVATLARQYESWESRRSPDGSELWLNWALQQKGNKQLVGHLQAGVLPDHADVAWFLGVRWQHLGYATEAAKAVVDLILRLGVREIRASNNPIHMASIRVAERLGLRGTNDFNDRESIWKRVYSSADAAHHKSD